MSRLWEEARHLVEENAAADDTLAMFELEAKAATNQFFEDAQRLLIRRRAEAHAEIGQAVARAREALRPPTEAALALLKQAEALKDGLPPLLEGAEEEPLKGHLDLGLVEAGPGLRAAVAALRAADFAAAAAPLPKPVFRPCLEAVAEVVAAVGLPKPAVAFAAGAGGKYRGGAAEAQPTQVRALETVAEVESYAF